MNTAVAPTASPTPSARGAADAVRDRPAEPRETRGRTTVEDRVIERMAVHIAAGEPEVGGAARRVLGMAIAAEGAERKPTVEVTVAGESVSLLVRLSVIYPASVRAVTDRLRQHLRDRVAALTGKTVGQVDIVVVALHRPTLSRRRVQ